MKMRSHLFTLMGACRRKSGKEPALINISASRFISTYFFSYNIIHSGRTNQKNRLPAKPRTTRLTSSPASDLRDDTAVNPPSTAGGRFLRGRRIGLRERTRAAIGELEQSGSPATAGRDISARQGYWTPGGSSCCDLRT